MMLRRPMLIKSAVFPMDACAARANLRRFWIGNDVESFRPSAIFAGLQHTSSALLS